MSPRPGRAVPEALPAWPLQQEAPPSSPLPVHLFEGQPWYYEPACWCDHRYILGRPGPRPLICFGINPSTATPAALDPTLQSVARIAAAGGFEGWIMFNVYPQRATDPNAMHALPRADWHARNVAWLRAALLQGRPTLWAAWGTLIEKRPYLPALLRQLYDACAPSGAPWVCFGACSRAGHPHHPLYLRRDEPPRPFDMPAYLAALAARGGAAAGGAGGADDSFCNLHTL